MNAVQKTGSSLLSSVKTGREERPILACFYGVPGVGKTTLAAHAPAPLLLCVEQGADEIDVPKVTRERVPGAEWTWDVVLDYMRALASESHEYRTLVVDTVDALEELAVASVLAKAKKATLADFDFGGGHFALRDAWRLFIKGCQVLRDAGMHIVLLAHSERKQVIDPQLGQYDCYTPKLDKRVWALTNEACTLVGFCQFETALFEKKNANRGIVTGARVMRVVKGTGYEAKNRYSLPATLPLDWRTLEDAIRAHSVAPEKLLEEQLTALLAELDDADTKAKAAEYFETNGRNARTLAEVINSVQFRLDQKKGQVT